jgi:general secretion pathway protein I
MNSDERGFTLIELLVSLAILTIALAVLFSTIGTALDRTRKSRNEAVAASLVQSLMARAAAAPATPGETEGTYSNGFSWQLDVRPYGSGTDAKAWHMSAYQVHATVSWPEGTRSLSALRLVPPPPKPQP